MNISKIPQDLKDKALCCVWKYEQPKDRVKPTKVPYNPVTGKKGQSNNRATFTSYDVALSAYNNGGYDDLGIGIFKGIAAIDIDHCISDEQCSDMAQDIIELMDSYTEISPSGTGIRIIFYADNFTYDKSRFYINNQEKGLEVYIAGCTSKYVTITGNVFKVKPIKDCSNKIPTVLEKYMRRPETLTHEKSKTTTSVVTSDEKIITLMKSSTKNGEKYTKLLNGDISNYSSHSEADMALCGGFVFYSGGDAETVDRLFRASKLFRSDKWDSPRSGNSTYGADTIKTAIAKCPEFYNLNFGQSAYYEESGHVYRRIGGKESRHLANFTSQPLEDTVKDDGVNEPQRYLSLSGKLASGQLLPKVSIATSKFISLNWITEYWGFSPRIMPGNGNKEYYKDYIQSQTEGIPHKTIYTHTGFRKINGKLCFLYHGGSIGADNIQCELDNKLSRYTFTDTQGIIEQEALNEVISLFNLASPEISYPLLAFTYLAPLNYFFEQVGITPAFCLFSIGKTGSFKTVLNVLYLAHFTKYNGMETPPTTDFHATPNAIEKIAFDLKDVPMVIDDYHPTSTKDKKRMDEIAQRLARAVSGHTGRDRMNSDTSLKTAYAPRGISMVTGEDTPAVTQSGLARYYFVKFNDNAINIDALNERQANASLLNIAMQGYIKWLIKNADDIQQNIKLRHLQQIKEVQIEGSHSRTAPIISWLETGIYYFVEFAIEVGVMDEVKADQFYADACAVFINSGREQARTQSEETPTNKFLTVLNELLASGRKVTEYLYKPESALFGTDKCLGYHDNEYYYLYPQTTYNAVCEVLHSGGSEFPVTKDRLLGDLAKEGIIVTKIESGTIRNTPKKRIGDTVQRYIILLKSALESTKEINENE